MSREKSFVYSSQQYFTFYEKRYYFKHDISDFEKKQQNKRKKSKLKTNKQNMFVN